MNLTFIAIGFLILAAGLNIPGLSEYLIIFASIGLLLRWLADMRAVDRGFAVRLSLLTLFTASYYSFTYIHGVTGLNEGIRNTITILGSYALGYTISSRNTPSWPHGLCFPLFCMVAGLVCFSFLCVNLLLSSGDVIQIAERITTSFWDGSEINAPGLGANASLAMCLLPVLFFGRGDERKGLFYPLVAFPVSIMLAAGLFINVTLQNRTPFLAMAASLLIGTVLYLHRHKREPSRAIKKVAVLGLLAGAVVYFLATSVDLSQLDIVTRFTEERLESLRYESWKTMLSSLHQSLLGGRAVRLGADLNYVHNLWLDVIWDAGFVPFVFLAAFHLKHVRCFKNIMRSGLPLLLLLVIIGIAISIFTNFMQEPTMSASVPYFAASCFFLGLVLRMSQDLEEQAEGL